MECHFAFTLMHRMPLPSYISKLSNHVMYMYLSQVLYYNFGKCYINPHIMQGSVMGHVIKKFQSYSWYHHLPRRIIVTYKEAMFTNITDQDTTANNTVWVNKNNTYLLSTLQIKEIWGKNPSHLVFGKVLSLVSLTWLNSVWLNIKLEEYIKRFVCSHLAQIVTTCSCKYLSVLVYIFMKLLQCSVSLWDVGAWMIPIHAGLSIVLLSVSFVVFQPVAGVLPSSWSSISSPLLYLAF